MENFQRADGGVDVPAVLRRYGAPDEIRPLRPPS
jgi:seryl-tRNA synthetase